MVALVYGENIVFVMYVTISKEWECKGKGDVMLRQLRPIKECSLCGLPVICS